MKNFKKGHTILETIIYLALFTLISTVVINSFIVVTASFAYNRTNRDLLESGSTAMERISREIRQASSVDLTNSFLGSTPGTLQLNSTDSAGNPLIIKFVGVNGALNLYQGGTLTANLIGQKVSLTSLFFRRIVTPVGEAVKIEMTLQDSRSKALKSENFYNTVILRGGY